MRKTSPLFALARFAGLLVMAALVGPAIARATDAPPLRLELAPAETTIGERVKVYLRSDDPTVTANRVQSVKFVGDHPDWEIDAEWVRDWRSQADGRPGPWHATVRPFALGRLALPSTVVDYRASDDSQREIRLTSATLTVNSIRPPGAQSLELIGLRDLAEVPRDFSRVGWLGAAVGGAAAAAWVAWWWRRRRRASVPAEPPLPPGLWALRELERRSRLSVCQTGPAKTIYSMVSEVMRLYLERRHGIVAIDMTTRECLQALHAQRLDSKILEWLRQFLEECDLVKFSRFEMPRERWATIWNDAKLIVQHTTPPEELNGGAPVPAPAEPVCREATP